MLLALVARLGLFAGNVVAHYALAATILQNGRSAALTADEEFLTSLVNATLQPPRYRPDTQPPHHLRSKRSPGSPLDSLTSSELAVLRALLQGPNPLPTLLTDLASFCWSESVLPAPAVTSAPAEAQPCTV